jgi:hypothetical protein
VAEPRLPLYRGMGSVTSKKEPEEVEANRALANDKRKLRHLWKGELTLAEIADEMELSEAGVLEFAETLGLDIDERPEIDCFIPTPEEIRLAAAEIRAGWSPAELEARRMPWHGRLE